MSDLKTCPFCGAGAPHQRLVQEKVCKHEAEHMERHGMNPSSYIQCDYCGARGPVSIFGNPVVVWDRRAASPDIPTVLQTDDDTDESNGQECQDKHDNMEMADALEPSLLTTLVQTQVDMHRDPGLWEEACEREENDRQALKDLTERWGDVEALLKDGEE